MEDMVNFWQDRNVFVTGGTGFIGPWVVSSLISKDANIVCLVRDRNSNSRFFLEGLNKKTTVVNGDLTDFYLMNRILAEYEIDTVIHLGAQALVPVANKNPLSTFESNIRGTWNILEACRLNDKTVKAIVVASSDKAYGSSDKLPYTEECSLKGEYPYDVSKSCADLIAQSYYKTFSLPVAISRFGNFYGGGDLNFNRLIPGVIRDVLRGRNPVIRSNGNFIRDYIYVKNAVSAYLLLAENLGREEIKGEAFNFSTEEKKTVLEIVNLILRLMNSKLEPRILNEVKAEIKEQTLDSSKARKLLNWKPEYSLEEGLKETIEWYKNFFS